MKTLVLLQHLPLLLLNLVSGLLLGLICSSLINPSLGQASPRLPSEKVAPIPMVLAEAKHLNCPNGFVANRNEWDNLSDAVKTWSFSPSCIWNTIRMNAEEYSDRPVHGFAFGASVGVSAGAGYSSGTELALMKYDDQTLLVGRIKVRAASVEVSLPMGASLTQSVLFGECDDSLFSYLGWFETLSAAAMSHSWARKRILPSQRGRTHCDAITSTRGLTSPVIGASVSHYSQLGKWILVQGPRVREMIDYIDSINATKQRP